MPAWTTAKVQGQLGLCEQDPLKKKEKSNKNNTAKQPPLVGDIKTSLRRDTAICVHEWKIQNNVKMLILPLSYKEFFQVHLKK
jgi:hypothetical protein